MLKIYENILCSLVSCASFYKVFTSSCLRVAGGKDDVEVLAGITPGLSDQHSPDVVKMLHEEPHNILYSIFFLTLHLLSHMVFLDQLEASNQVT